MIGATNLFHELDVIEAVINNGAGANNRPAFFIHITSAPAQPDDQKGEYTSTPILDQTTFHTFGALYLTPAQNGGTGIVRRYIDGVLHSGCFDE
jgi:hypothetical protein